MREMPMCWLQQAAQLWYYPTFLLIPLGIIACIECFAGYYAWRFLLGLNGAVLGFIAGAILCMLLGSPMLILVGAFAGAGAGVALFAGIVPLGSFVFAFGTAASLAILLARAAGLSPYWLGAATCGAGMTAAVATLTVRRPVMIALSAIAGAQQIASSWRAYHLPYDTIPVRDELDPSELAAFLVLVVAGLLFQFATFRSRPHVEPLPQQPNEVHHAVGRECGH